MAKKSLKIKCSRSIEKANQEFKKSKKIKLSTKLYHRCFICGRNRWYIWKFNMCRICIREKSNFWELVWVRKSSW